MTELKDRECEACRKGAPLATEEEIESMLPEIPEWQIVADDGIQKLRRDYSFSDFSDALAFTVKVGELADDVGHHPTLITEWGKVSVYFFSKKIRGLHVTDFIMAARTDDLYQQLN
ncbi:MAG: 4a-hydroxytetrahydrobiopterin dehydratase [Gammaproteobacteria bacterium]